MKKSFALGLLLISQISFASILDIKTYDHTKGGLFSSGYDVPSTGTLTLSEETFQLTRVGYGTRTKVGINVYRASLMVTETENYIRTAENNEALNSLRQMTAVVLRMEFLRAVDSKTIQEAFAESLAANGVELEDESIKAFGKAVQDGGAMKKGSIITIAANEKAGTLTYEGPDGVARTIKGTSEFLNNIFAIWLGHADDEQLKDDLIKKYEVQN